VAIPPDYHVHALYGPEAWFIHDVLEIGPERVVGVSDTLRLGVLVDAQRERRGHPKHVPGAVMVQITGTLGHLHAVYGLGLSPAAGWAGFGTHILEARFGALGVIGPAMTCTCEATRVRNLRGTMFVDYQFTYLQDDVEIYRSRQRAAWICAGTPAGE
jgi:hypothetical protein